MGAFNVELATLGYQTGVNHNSKVTRKRVAPNIGMRVEYGCYKEGTVMYVSDSLIVVRWDSPQASKYGGWVIQEEAIPAHHSFYESKDPSHDNQ